MMNHYINHFRPIYEFRAAVGWTIAALLILLSGMPHAGYFALLCYVPYCYGPRRFGAP
jgi:conjugal transfer pilus assembly protein TraD